MTEEKWVTIYIVTFNGGSARISSVRGIEKGKTYRVDLDTREDYFGWQYISSRVRKEKNVFYKARDAAQYAIDGLAKWINAKEEEIGDAKQQRVTLYQMLNKQKEE